MSSFYAIEAGSDSIVAKADSIEELMKLVGPRSESLNKSYTILGTLGEVVPVKSYEYRPLAQEEVVVPAAQEEDQNLTSDSSASEGWKDNQV